MLRGVIFVGIVTLAVACRGVELGIRDSGASKPNAPATNGCQVVRSFVSSAYRNVVLGGIVRFAASLDLPSEPDGRAWLAFVDRWGKPRKIAAESYDRTSATFTVAATKIADGRSEFRLALEDASGSEVASSTLTLERPDRRPKDWRSWFDENQILRVNGRKVFPVGVTFSGKGSQTNWPRFMSSGITMLKNYCWLTRKQLDDCLSNGIHVVYSGGLANCAAADEKVERRVRPVIDHPAVIGWYLNDEPRPPRQQEMERLQARMEALDPTRFTYSIYDHCEFVGGFLRGCDVFAMDPYPVGRAPVRQVFDVMEQMRRGPYAMRPLWACVQDFDWRWFKMGARMPSARMPTRGEVSSMAWQAIAAGATGIELFGPHHFFDAERLETSERNFADMKALVGEIRRLSPALVSSEPAEHVAGVPSSVRVRTWRLGKDNYLLAVNLAEERVRATLKTSEPFAVARLEAGAGLARTNEAEVALDLAPLGYGVLHLCDSGARLFLAGDSLLAPSLADGRQSWGERLAPHLAGGVTLVNFALGGASTRTFRNLGLWDEILCRGKEGDWVVVSFGHNDSSLHKRDRGVFVPDFKDNLRRFLAEAAAKGMRPLLVTPVATGTFAADGAYRDVRNLAAYAEAMREVASETGVTLVDLHEVTRRWVEDLGPEKSRAFFMAKTDGADTTHLNADGAAVVAEFFRQTLKMTKVPANDKIFLNN